MRLANTILSACECAVAFVSMEYCRVCKQVVHSKHLRAGPLSICQSCWDKLFSQRPLIAWKSVFPDISFPIISAGAYTALLRKTILRLKHTEDGLLASDLAFALAAAWRSFNFTNSGQSPYIVPIPLHANKENERGYNQSAIIAGALARELGLKCLAPALVRVMDTRPQRGLGKEARADNIIGAFSARVDLARQRVLVLVDDVHTSGATLREAARELCNAGADSIVGLTVAAAPLYFVRD